MEDEKSNYRNENNNFQNSSIKIRVSCFVISGSKSINKLIKSQTNLIWKSTPIINSNIRA